MDSISELSNESITELLTAEDTTVTVQYGDTKVLGGDDANVSAHRIRTRIVDAPDRDTRVREIQAKISWVVPMGSPSAHEQPEDAPDGDECPSSRSPEGRWASEAASVGTATDRAHGD